MKREAKISNYQLAIMVMGFFYGSTSIANPAMAAKRDAWLAVLLGTLGGILLVTLYLYISKINNGRNLVEILEYCFGKICGKLFCILYILYFLYLSTYNARTFGEFMIAVSYPETPMIVLVSLLIICAVYAARSGLSVIGKTCEVLVPLLPAAVMVVTLSLLNASDFTGFKPMLLEVGPVIRSSIDLISNVYGDFVVFIMVLPYTTNTKGRFKATYWAIAAIFVIMFTTSTRNIQLIGPALTDYIRYPSHVAAQMIPGISIDPLVDMNLLIGGGVKATICLYGCAKIASEIAGIENCKPLIAAFAMIPIVLGFWFFPDAVELYHWAKSMGDSTLSIFPQLLVPIAILIISIIKNRKKKREVRKTPPELIIG